MCLFCAAIPLTAAIGVKMNAEQKTARQDSDKENIQPRHDKPIAKVTIVAVILLTVCSFVYHAVLSPLYKI